MRCCSNRTGQSLGQARGARALRGARAARTLGLASGLLSLLLLRATAATGTNGPAAPVFHAGLPAAMEAAAGDQSLVLLVFEAQWCGPCKQYKADTLNSREFLAQAGALHVAEVDVDADPSTARAYGVEAIPNSVLLTPDKKIVARQVGFMATADLLLWLRQGRDRAKAGTWEGTAPGTKLDAFAAKAKADQLGEADLVRLTELLGDPSPADREAAARLLAEQREQAMAPLIDALTNAYLGIRISAAELIRQLAPEAPAVDPWQGMPDRTTAAAALRKWWEKAGRLPAAAEVRPPDTAVAGSVQSALEMVRGNDPVRRTAGMSALVACGASALPAVREAIKRGERAGDQASLSLLEEVRWAILVPDTLEKQTAGLRSVLARGQGPERQAAVTHLTRAGRAAIPALTELLSDADPLVVESAVRALSSIGGKDLVPAMAALLKAPDSNLRMTTAQALGKSRDPAAVKELLTVFDDPNEVVACAAISAVEEIKGGEGYVASKAPPPPEVVKGLKAALADPRWRVRAAAAEVAGKLEAKLLIPDLNALLGDLDGFVVKNSLEALGHLGATPDTGKLVGIARRHTGLRGQAVELLVGSGEPDAAKAVADLYQSSPVDERISVLHSIGAGSLKDPEATTWQPLLSRAVSDADARVRRAGTETLGTQPAKVAVAMVGSLLADEDLLTRSAAAKVILAIVAGQRTAMRTAHGSGYAEMIEEEVQNWAGSDVPVFFEGMGSSVTRSGKKAARTNAPPATAQQLADWHTALQRKAGAAPDLLTAGAIYVTGDSNRDLAVLQHALERADKAAMAEFGRAAAAAAIVPRLPWPAGQAVLQRFCGDPTLFLHTLRLAERAPKGASDFLFEPARFRAAVEPASEDDLQAAMQWLLGSVQNQWSLCSDTPRAAAVVTALLEATNPVWRAAAVYCAGLRDDPKSLAAVERALKDSNSWVRATAVAGLGRAIKERPVLEQRLGPLVADLDKRVERCAATALLEPETLTLAGVESAGHFEFEKIHIWSYSPTMEGEARPVGVVEGNPPFLNPVRQRLAKANLDEAGLDALLLAQYGDFSGLERLVAGLGNDPQQHPDLVGPTLAGIALSKDVKYLPWLAKMVETGKDESDYRKALQALRGMTGPQARELRLTINRRIRRNENNQ